MKKLFLLLFLPVCLLAQPSGGVSQIKAGNGVTITPTSGKGIVTVNATGAGNVTNNATLASGNVVIGGGTTVVGTTNISVSGGNSMSMPGGVTTGVGGSVGGALGVGQGTLPPLGTTSVQIVAPTSVTSYNIILPGAAGSTGYPKWTVGSGNSTISIIATIPAADIAVGALANGMTATTQAIGSNNTTVSTTSYADLAARAAHLGTFASPNTAAGAQTWVAPVLNIYTSTNAATRTYTLPAASTYSGQAIILNVAVGVGHANIQPASGAQLVLAGVLLTADHYVQAATTAPGNYICFISDGTYWTSLGSSGTWADAASP